MITHFYSDPHFGHTKVISRRPFASADEMTRELIARYNTAVSPSGTVMWCGDCFFVKPDEAAEIMRALNGSKLLVVGNHDRGKSTMAQLGFTAVADEMFISIAGRTARVSHYPYRTGVDERHQEKRPQRPKGSDEVLIHGHTHRTEALHDRYQVDVGVDAWAFFPATFASVEALFA